MIDRWSFKINFNLKFSKCCMQKKVTFCKQTCVAVTSVIHPTEISKITEIFDKLIRVIKSEANDRDV